MTTPKFYRTDDLRIKWTKVVLPPVFLEEELPETENASSTIYHARKEISEILAGTDRRLLVVVGPCSIHDTKAAREYAGLLKGAIAELSRDLRIVMRVYFEKPRTTVGWKGLLNDPHLDQSFKINDGLRLARHLLLDLAEMGVPAGTEFLDMISPQYVAGLVSWGAIGARTTESQVHRQLVSGLSCPVGFKGMPLRETRADCGGRDSVGRAAAYVPGPHEERTVRDLCDHRQSGLSRDPARRERRAELRRGGGGLTCANNWKTQRGWPPRVMIDCSHANSSKDYKRQVLVCRQCDVAGQIAKGDRRIIGVMIESNLVAGAQKLVPGKPLVYGQSITGPVFSVG